MEMYYTKKEYNEMKNVLTKKCKLLEKQILKLTKQIETLKSKD